MKPKQNKTKKASESRPEKNPADLRLGDAEAIKYTRGEETMRRFADHIGRVVTGNPDFKAESYESEVESGVTVFGKRSRFDLIIVDPKVGTVDLEAQKRHEDNLAERMNLYAAQLIIRDADKGKRYEDIRDSYIVFACLGDPMRSGKPVQIIEMKDQFGEQIEGKVHWIVLSEANNKEPRTEIEWLSHDMFARLEKIHDTDMRERLQYLRKEEVFRNMHLETREEEIARKLEEQRKALEAERCIAIVKQMEADRENTVRQMLMLGIEPDKIAEVTRMPLSDVLEIANRK
ncbi:MAG: PD-(D/E)XK nuclease family transposase [Bacilli bacterium]|nr:PD-(D/E)XK nuclease family transposase [Bacilli bacterium]